MNEHWLYFTNGQDWIWNHFLLERNPLQLCFPSAFSEVNPQGFAARCSLSTSTRPPPHALSGLTEQPPSPSNQVKWPALSAFSLTPPFTAFQSVLLTTCCEPAHQRDSASPSMPSRTRSSLWLLQDCSARPSLINSCCCWSKVKWKLVNYRKETNTVKLALYFKSGCIDPKTQ